MQEIRKNILECISEGVIYQLANGQIKLWNKAAERIFGLSAEEAIGNSSIKQHRDLIYEDGSPCPDNEHPAMITLETGRALSGEIRGSRQPDGSVTWLSINTNPVIKPGNAKPSAVVISFQDVTGKIDAEHASQQSDRRYSAAAQMAKLGYWARNFSDEKAVWSPELFKIFGLDPALGAPTNEEFFNGLVHPEDRANFTESVQNSLASGEPLNCEYRIIRPDGKLRFVHSVAEAQMGLDGTFSLLFGFLQDITSQKLLELEISRSKTFLENVYASLEEAVFVVDPETSKIISCNTAAENVFGYRKEEMIGRNTQFLHLSKKHNQEFGKGLLEALDKEGIFRTEFKLRRKDGTVFSSDHTVKEIRDENGLRIMFVSVVRDISYQKQIVRQLKQKSKELSAKALNLEELNVALKVMLEYRDQEKRSLEENFALSINSLILPYLDRIKKTKLSVLQEEYINVLEQSLKDISKPYVHRISDKLMLLSPSETKVANYVKQGCGNKEIAALLGVSDRTIEFHRDNIRKKLGIKGRKINLRTYLSSF
jgi:PAS domain S-box-containing protein